MKRGQELNRIATSARYILRTYHATVIVLIVLNVLLSPLECDYRQLELFNSSPRLQFLG